MFFFQSMFQQVYSGITGSTTLITVQTIAESILLLAILFALYEAYARAGDMRALALAGIRYLIMSLIISQYPNVFHNVNNAFNSVAAAIAPTDVLTNYRSQVANYLSSPSGQGAWWNIVTGDIAGALSLVFQLVAVFIFPITYVLFSFFYSMYGAVLYVCGPLVLALYPAFGMGQLARTYMVNMLIWNVWGIIYAIMSQLLTIMSADSLTSIFTAQNFGGAFQGASQMLLISLSSILISLIIALIPFIAKRVVSGDVGSTLFAVVSAAAAAVQTAAVAMAGMSAGGAASRGPNPDPPDPPGGGNPTGGSNRAPRPPGETDTSESGSGGTGGDAILSSQPPKGPDDHGETHQSGGAVRTGEQPSSDGGGGSPPPTPPSNGGSSVARQRHPHVSGLYYIPYGAAWAAGRTVRAVNEMFVSRDKEES
jgi:hypothetical protein